MTVPAPPPAPTPAICQLCDTPLAPSQDRCPECGLRQRLGPTRPDPFVGRNRGILIGVLVALWVLVLAIVAIVWAAS